MEKINKSDPFCFYLKHQIRFYQDQIEPCCWFGHKINASVSGAVDQYKKLVQSIDSWSDACHYCQNLESRNLESPRTAVAKNPASMFGITDDTGPTDIVALEVQIDTECNAACLICGPHNSTTWQKYQSTTTVDKSLFNKKIDLISLTNTQKYINRIKQSVDFSKINQITFVGGEPLLNDNHVQFIEEIKKFKPLNLVKLRYITNGSHVPTKETIELWRQAKHVGIAVSLDGIGEHFNYLRWPLQWSQVEKNMIFFRDLDLPNLKFNISSTITPFNIFYYDRYLEWQENFFKDHKSKLVKGFQTAHSVNGGDINLMSVPPLLTNLLKIKFKEYPWLLEKIETFNSTRYEEFMKYICFHDQKRGTNWKDSFPEIVKYFE